MMNRVVIVGRMTRDPELNRTSGGNSVCHFTLALDRNFKSGDGQQADFIPVVVWNKQAENVAQYCGKGSLVGVDGRLRSRSYDNKQGQRVYVVEVQADSVQFLETRAARERYQANAQSRVSNDNFYNGNSYGNNQQANSYQSQNNNYSQQSNSYNNAANTNNFNQNTKPQNQNQNNDFYDMKTVDVDKDFDEAVNSYDIMDDDIQF
ncbi:single-stranded DNA-binding protein [Intestinibaculum porci]|jgi:single-strand DNA-binding protein|uniref:single-stranded DNA-binding protein n=1 Tax=Intestinibaculum porci TaxID=2487118 RepID=UPI000EEDBAE5|nr:single-stranded DNA-binding protein [Intestinibaculum porci]MDD6348634.1 single-stranded DNA-binding protein [Intestinibaculum porci]MDD6423732.1 single-stranded DNA-binding protein [Intestinibaculum porci]HAN57507.1 single-stranded DNA-binding protein [Erysipelotrichaceae bacterium]